MCAYAPCSALLLEACTHQKDQADFSCQTCRGVAVQAPLLSHCCSTMALAACQALSITAQAALALLMQRTIPLCRWALERAGAGRPWQLMACVLCRVRLGSASWDSRGRLVGRRLARAGNLCWAGRRCGPGDQPLWQECGHGGRVQPAHGGGRWVCLVGCLFHDCDGGVQPAHTEGACVVKLCCQLIQEGGSVLEACCLGVAIEEQHK